MLKTAFVAHEEGLDAKKVDGYWLEEIDEPTFFPGHAAAIFLRLDGKQVRIGEFGILHPTVLEKFELRYVIHDIEA